MGFFLLLLLPYIVGLVVLAVIFTSLRVLPYVVAIGVIVFAVSWLLG